MAAPSFDDLFNLGKAEMLLRRPDLFLAPGDITDFVVAMSAAMADKCIEFAKEEARKTFIDGATGDDLTTLVDDHFNIQRADENASTVNIDLTRPSAGGPAEPAGTIPIGFTISTEEDESGDRQEYTIDTAVSWVLSEVGTKVTTATAVVAGREGNVAAGQITNLVDSPFDSSITVTNPSAAAGGNAEETDNELRERARAFPSTLRRGTLAALEFGALTVASVRVATAVEDLLGAVTVFVTDENGASSAQMVTDVAAELDNWRCAGSVVTVTGGALFSQDIDYTLDALAAGVTQSQLAADIDAALTERLRKLPVGDGSGIATNPGVLRVEIVESTIIGVDPDSIFGVTVNNPAADVVPTAGQLIRAGTITGA